MKKIFSRAEFVNLPSKERATYSEEYVVAYMIMASNGLYSHQVASYWAAGKNSHKEVAARFQQDKPRARLLGVTYQ